jgi:hypothetical protein
MASTPPPKNKTQVSESEVIDPHLRITFPKPEGWDNWNDDRIKSFINYLSAELKYEKTTFIKFDRSYDKNSFKYILPGFDLSKFDDNTSYYNTSNHYLTLYIHFPDADFNKHNEDKWKATIKIDGNIISSYDEKVIPYQPKRNS